MAARYLLDTDIFIYQRQRRSLPVQRRFALLRPGEAVISIINFGELMYGVEKNPARAKALAALESMQREIPVLPLPLEAGVEYGALRAHLEAKGELIGSNDLWIAAHAKTAGLILVTNNEREFRRVPGLKIQNWTTS